MFHSARLHLTGWYLLLIMGISILFSVAFYTAATSEIQRVMRVQEFREQHPGEDMLRRSPSFFVRISPPRAQDLQETAERLKWTLIFINAGIFFLAGGGGYFLAGRTLKPIQDMVTEQRRFITDASHELRTPITSLRSEIEVGLRQKNLTLPEARALLESNLEEVISLQSLSDNLLQLTQAKPVSHSSDGVVMAESIKGALKIVSPLAIKKQIKLMHTERSGSIKGDSQRIIQLFVILLDNAIKYSPQSSTITITHRRTDRYVRVLVVDQGVGIAKEDLPFIFDRFYRADKSRSRESGGYGLGLAIAKKIAEDYNGSIHFSSTLGKGTTVTVKFPVIAGKNN